MRSSLPKILLLFAFLLLFSIWHLAFRIERVNAQIPPPRVPCIKTDNPEFHSLRPYQASPCGDPPKAQFCGNKVVIKESYDDTAACGETFLNVNWQVGTPSNGKDYWIDISETEFPIAGNTELVKNSQKEDDSLDDAQKVNEYASWYLSGVNNKAEYGDTKNTPNEVVNFSGPIQKLFPSIIQEAQRIESIKNAITPVNYTDEGGGAVSDVKNHDQIVVCAHKEAFGISNPLIGKTVAHECYDGNGSSANFRFYRLTEWLDHLPPLPWDEKYKNDSEKYKEDRCEWEGGLYINIPFTQIGICAPNPLNSNEWADLFPYVPLSNTADKNAKMLIDPITIQASNGVVLDDKKSVILKDGEPVFFYPHTYEVKELSEFLNKSYTPQGVEQELPADSVESNKECRVADVRSNEGDDLFPINKTPSGEEGDIGVEIYFKVSQIPCSNVCYTNRAGEEVTNCSGEVYIEVHTKPVKVPSGDEIWKNTVAGSNSIFRRIFPKVEEGAPVSCIADTPSETKAVYKPTEGTKEIGVTGPLGSPEEGKFDPEDARIYFPHFGGVYDYFLKGIQTALRPKGYGTPITSGELCENETSETGACKQWLFEKSSGGSFYYNKVIQAAASTTCNGEQLNPYWAVGIALNENGGLMSDLVDGSSNSHFGCNIPQVQTIEEKISCMTNTLRNDCLAGKTDEQILEEYGYAPGYVLYPITVLDYGNSYPPPLFGSGFDTQKLLTNLLNTDWVSVYESQAPTFCPNSPTLEPNTAD